MSDKCALDGDGQTKTKQGREIPISPTLREVLVRRQKAHPKEEPWPPKDCVFGDEIGRFDDLRHEAGSRKLEAAMPCRAGSVTPSSPRRTRT